ncbi:Protein of unknown function [Cotesia congregata]|uniref:Uncharacterized protein n=1 Tax=Cotesia congregata TaxID=51543 RepID=A0A8J2HN22_COTCN|nr:Protein of unknown function [Cotesia congregata]
MRHIKSQDHVAFDFSVNSKTIVEYRKNNIKNKYPGSEEDTLISSHTLGRLSFPTKLWYKLQKFCYRRQFYQTIFPKFQKSMFCYQNEQDRLLKYLLRNSLAEGETAA